jgi:spermidine synthase
MDQPPDRSLVPLACGVGAAALVAQTALVRELMVSFYGTELAVASALCCWLAFVVVGALAAAIVLKGRPHGRPLVHPPLVALAVALPAGLVVARLVRPILRAQVGEFLPVTSMAAGAALAACTVAIPVGFLFAAAARCEEQHARRRAGGVTRVYVAEAMGSAAAGALLSFCLLGRLAPTALAFAAAVMLLAVAAARAAGASGWLCLAGAGFMAALLCWSATQQRPALFFGSVAALAAAACLLRLATAPWRRAGWAAGIACAALAFLLSTAYLAWGKVLDETTVRARWNTFSTFRLVATLDTRYQEVGLGEREGDYALVQDGRRTAQFPDRAAAQQEAALLLTQHARPRDVLVIGGGLEGLCQQMLAAPIRALDYVEPDPQLVRFLFERLPAELAEPLRDHRFAAYACDGRFFVRKSAEDTSALARAYVASDGSRSAARRPAGAYDLIVVNVGDPASASQSRFYAVEFCRELRHILRPGGAVAFCGVTAGENIVRDSVALDYAACIYRTVRSVFSEIVVRPGDEFFFFAATQPGVVSDDPPILAARFEALGLQPDVLKHSFERAEFPRERTQHVARLLAEAGESAYLNTDERPVAFMLFLALESQFAGRAIRQDSARASGGGAGMAAGILRGLRSGAPQWFWLVVVGLLLPSAAARAAFGRHRAVPWACGVAVFTSGAFGLAAEMLIVYGYQTQFGYVYRDLGAIVGLFMLGLALGGLVSGRLVGRAGRPLLAAEAAQAVLLLALPAVVGVLSFSPYAFMLLSPAVGFLTGAEFPLAAGLSLAGGHEAGAVAGVLNAADSLGGLTGGAVAGLLLVPAMGLVQTAALLALVKCASLAGLVLAFVRVGGPAP